MWIDSYVEKIAQVAKLAAFVSESIGGMIRIGDGQREPHHALRAKPPIVASGSSVPAYTI
jgi:hypothetical protein